MNAQMTTVDLGLASTGLDTGCRDCGGRHDDGGCGGDGCGCGHGQLERPRWFPGQLVGPADLESIQQWVLGRSRRHNRMVHGWGVSCGLAVEATRTRDQDPVPWSVTVSPGFALSACGDDICLPDAVRIDIRQPRPSGSDVCAPPVDPWCAPVRQRRDPDRTYYLAIRYAEQQTRPVRGACSCGCDGDPCEYSRIAEAWTFAVLDSLPDCYDEATRGPAGAEAGGLACSREIRARGTRRCPDCCDPWVVLADLRVTASGAVSVDPLAHRRFLAQLGEHAFFCGTDTQPKRVDFSAVERETIAGLFAAGERSVVDAGAREAVLTSPATALRGGKASKAIRTLVESMSVGELASLDTVVLRTKAADIGADADAVDRLVESARLAVRLAQPG